MTTLDQVNNLIRNRRSIYPNSYSSREKIPQESIDIILENANWAPTHRLTEPWRFTVFSEDGLMRLAEFQSELYARISRESGTFDETNFRKLLEKPLLASHIVSIGMRRDPKESVPEIEEIAAVACAVQNMYLTASAMGIGCYWTTGGVTYYDEAKPFFELGLRDRLMGFMYFGVPTGKWPQGRRKPIGDKVRFRNA